MGTVFKKTYTKPIPAGAEFTTRSGKRYARWKVRGKSRTAEVSGDRIKVKSVTYTAKFRDGSGNTREVATGCKDETAAKQFLANLEKRADSVRSGLRSAAEDAIIDHQATPIATHFEAYREHQRMKGVDPQRVKSNQAKLKVLAADCGFETLADLRTNALETWLDEQSATMSPGNRNAYRETIMGFCNWCKRPSVGRMLSNPFTEIAKADAKSDQRRKRRAMTEAELIKLLKVARERPLIERLTIRRGKRKGELAAKLTDKVRARLEREGWERALIYKMLVLTGLRKGELAALTVGHLELDGAVPFVQLAPIDEKNREGNPVALRADLVTDLRAWLGSDALPANRKIFNVPTGLLRILNRDLALAGIAKKDERGRTLDIHALRHSFGTLLSKGGVAPRTAQAAMRHSSIDLTMNTYTDPKLLDVHGALNALPALPLTDSAVRLQVHLDAPLDAPKAAKACEAVLIADKIEKMEGDDFTLPFSERVNVKGSPTTSCGEPYEVGATRFELATSTSRT